jgi:hypothetical protein
MSKMIAQADRCQVGKTKIGKYQVWHKVMGKGTHPKFVNRDKVLDTIDELLDEYNRLKEKGLWVEE